MRRPRPGAIRALAVLAALGIVVVVGYRLTIAPPFALRQDGPPPAFGPAGNGLVAFSVDGDIFVGDPVSGASMAIVTGPTNDTTPTFSPDGERIAFVRADSMDDADILVVRPDGSDMHPITAENFTGGIPGFAWTPDSSSILLNHDARGTPFWDGVLSLADVAGVGEPRLITPPLQAQIGYTYFSIYDPVAPIVRPVHGDHLVGGINGAISVVAMDGTPIEGFVSPSLADFRAAGADLSSVPGAIDRLAWSRDGSMISFAVASELFVMNHDGSHLRRFDTDQLDRAWSPDGSMIALEKRSTGSDEARGVIAILEIETGAEHALEATSAVVKEMAVRETDPDAFRTSSVRTYHDYAYEGWGWTPDGRSITILDRHGTRPFLVDIETGVVSELPWVVDGHVSWQRVALD